MRPNGIFALLFLLLLATVLPSAARAQTAKVPGDWETLRPEGEEFSILMPKSSSAETSKEPYHKMTLNTRLYLWTIPAGPVFAVASLSGIKANPAMYTEMERVNSYVDAFKGWFPKKVRGKDAVAKLTLVGAKTLNGHTGREYKLTIGDLSGSVNVYATRRRFYAAVVLNTKKDDALSDRFLSSFFLPDKIIEAPATVASQKKETKVEPEEFDPGPNFQGQKPDKPDSKTPAVGAEGSTETPTDSKNPTPASTPEAAGKRAPISGGVLNGKAITLPRPEYPADARAARVGGVVVVQITVDEYGNVISARAVSGNQMLHQVCVNAANQARFAPTFLMGEAVKVTGVITYNFVPQ
ncbi:MAG: TonB family protein [Pyrinomonadaceae bacterium]|nr:TonB family protein [Pyrinomonadaceae bacterium]